MRGIDTLLTGNGTLKVTDFGLAKALDYSKPLGVFRNLDHLGIHGSRTGKAAGTCTHMAPEQFDDAKHVDVRADIYSFGIMLFQMFVGHLPFRGSSFQEFKRLHKTASMPPLMTSSRRQKKSLRALEKIVRTCLEKSPSRRFSDFIVLRERLTELYAAATREALARTTKKAAAPCKIAEPLLRFQTAPGSLDRSEEFARAGASMHKLARFEDALISYEKALQLMDFDPLHKPVTQAHARVVIQMVRSTLGVCLFEKADRCCELLLHCKVKDRTIGETALLLRALANYASGRKRKAVYFCDQIIANNPRSLSAWYCKAGALLQMHEWENYRSALEKCLELQSVGPGWVIPGVRNKLSKGWWRKGWWWEEATGLDLDYLEWLAKWRGFSIDRRGRSK